MTLQTLKVFLRSFILMVSFAFIFSPAYAGNDPGKISTKLSPALVSSGKYIYLVYIDNAYTIRISKSTNSLDFGPEIILKKLGSNIMDTPALTVFNNRLYMFFRGPGNTLNYTSSENGDDWSDSKVIPGVSMLGAPAAAVYKGKMYVSHSGTGVSGQYQLWYTTSIDGNAWSADYKIESKNGIIGSPSMAVYNQELYIAHRDGIFGKSLVLTRTNGDKWSEVEDSGVKMSESPAIAVFNGVLYISHNGSNSTFAGNSLWVTTYDGNYFSKDEDQKTSMYESPALVMFNDELIRVITKHNSLLWNRVSYGRIKAPVPLLDVWGEGYIVDGKMVSGFDGVQNINRVDLYNNYIQYISNGPNKGQPIPNLAPVQSWDSPEFPIEDNKVSIVTVMGATMNADTAKEISRVLLSSGGVVLYGLNASEVDTFEKFNRNMKDMKIPNCKESDLLPPLDQIRITSGADTISCYGRGILK